MDVDTLRYLEKNEHHVPLESVGQPTEEPKSKMAANPLSAPSSALGGHGSSIYDPTKNKTKQNKTKRYKHIHEHIVYKHPFQKMKCNFGGTTKLCNLHRLTTDQMETFNIVILSII